jgi:hypothetical protein
MGFSGHGAHHSPERMGLQAVWANIWCAALAGFRRDRGSVAGVARGIPVSPLSRGRPVPEVLLSRLRCKALDYTGGVPMRCSSAFRRSCSSR